MRRTRVVPTFVRNCAGGAQVYATYTARRCHAAAGVCAQQAGFRVAVLRSSVATDKREDWYERNLRLG